ncbi:tol-pal system protein YbgF [bacterium]|nr:tol-pal system protein YbgF [bacterium]
MKRILSVLLLASTAFTAPAFAQNWNSEQAAKLERLERDMQVMQQQVYKGGARPPAGNVAAASGNYETRLAEIEEQMRRLNGKIEELQFSQSQANQQLPARIQRLEDKLLQLEQQQMNGARPAVVAPTPAPAPAAAPTAAPAPAATPATAPANNAAAAAAAAAGAPAPATPAVAATPSTAAQTEYHQAFQLLNQARFQEARTMLQGFTQKYPNDPLIGNAYYWLGETFYVEKDYPKAMDNFRKGYEASPEGQKASDNLLKLGLSLSALNKTTEACVVYNQLGKRFPNLTGAVRQKLDQEKLRLSCQ